MKIIHLPDPHDCQKALAAAQGGELPASAPIDTIVECDCGKRYIRREHQFDGLYWALHCEPNHGYTEHGHPCCGQYLIGRPPGMVVNRCGGVHLCGQCQRWAAEIHAS